MLPTLTQTRSRFSPRLLREFTMPPHVVPPPERSCRSNLRHRALSCGRIIQLWQAECPAHEGIREVPPGLHRWDRMSTGRDDALALWAVDEHITDHRVRPVHGSGVPGPLPLVDEVGGDADDLARQVRRANAQHGAVIAVEHHVRLLRAIFWRHTGRGRLAHPLAAMVRHVESDTIELV